MSPRHPEVGQAIRAARLSRKWSQEQAAAFVGVTRFHWIRWEQGLHMPNLEHRPRLIEMGVDPSVFHDEDDAEQERAIAFYRATKAALA